MSANETSEIVDEIDPIANAIMQGGSGHDAPSSGADVEPESGADVEEAPEELILGKFKSPDDVLEAYKNLEAYNTQQNQRLSELEALLSADDEEEYEAPRPWGVQFNGEPENEEQLVGWAEQDPGQAAQWAIANADRVPKETVDGLWSIGLSVSRLRRWRGIRSSRRSTLRNSTSRNSPRCVSRSLRCVTRRLRTCSRARSDH
jgi:hypothetical protein